ncbi:hypothetical protein [Mycobacterium lehmannii]|uniref:hypothetical protein n=1 Tax=Mycobacterium lehmannii TaxID=2048550 RepID=UPI000B93EBC9|nr:hypothetical protein [Mycobacterium lehmannii]
MITSVAIALARPRGRLLRYSACSQDRCWTGTVRADSVDTAILDVVRRVREEAGCERIRLVVHLPPRSTLWALRDEVALLIPGAYLERPRLADEELVRAAYEELRVEASTA